VFNHKYMTYLDLQANEAKEKQFEMLFIMVGSCINEDGSLGAYHATPGLEGVCFLFLFDLRHV
jgi:hypothetical protein